MSVASWNDWETLELEAGGASAGLLVPGRVLRALGIGLGIPAEDVGSITPGRGGAGVALVELAAARAAQLETPRYLATQEGGRPAVFVLRRADERDEDARRELLVTWDAAAGEAPTPGAIAAALAEAMAPRLAAEDVGFGLAGVGFLRVQVPLAAALSGIPVTLASGTRTFGVELAEKKTWAR